MRPFLVFFALFFPFLLSARSLSPAANSVSQHSSLTFIENKGQVTDQNHKSRKDILFKINAPGLDIFIGKGQLHYQWSKANATKRQSANRTIDRSALPDTSRIQTYRLDVTLINANPNAKVVTEETQDYYENYYLPQCPDGIIAHSYKRITYKNIYPNIDWVLYFSNNTSPLGEAGRGFKYDFIVHKGGDPKNIKLQYNGATSLAIDKGALTATTPMGSITEQVPYTYNAITKKQIASSFLLHDNILSFDLAPYNGEIVIDPQLDWATYYGGSGAELFYNEFQYAGLYNNQLATDLLGYVYMTGSSYSNNIATSPGAFQNIYADSLDGFIVKFNALGIPQWATYYGGGGKDVLEAIVCDSNNNVYVNGFTNSKTLATSLSFQDSAHTHFSSDPNYYLTGVLAKFNSSGNRLWATYFGDSSTYLTDIAIGAGNEVYITGYTQQSYGIATPGSHQINFPGIMNSFEVFLEKFDDAGFRQWGTYYGESIDNFDYSLACDRYGNVYLGGNTSHYLKDSIIVTPGSFQDTGMKGGNNCFLAKFNNSGQRQWGTYYGSTAQTSCGDIAVDIAGNVYMVGGTSSVNSIATTGSYQEHLLGYVDAYIVKFNGVGQRLWGSYCGSGIYLSINIFYSVLVDKTGDVCIVGSSWGKTTGMATAGSWQSHNAGNKDGVFVKFDPNGKRLWGTYYGGIDDEEIWSVAVDISNNVYFGGLTSSNNGIATSGSFQPLYAGNQDAFLVKADPDSVVYTSFPDSVICINNSGTNFEVGYIVSRSFRSGNIFTAQISDSSGSFASPFVIGSKTATASGFIDCHLPPAFILGKHYRIRVLSSAPFYIAGDNGRDIEIRLGPETPTASTTDTLLCAGQTLHLFASSANTNGTYTWTGPDSFTSNTQNPVVNNIAVSGSGNYIVYADPVVCKMADTLSVIVRAVPIKPVISTNAPVCEGDTLRFSFAEDTAGTFYTWAWPNPNVIPGQNTVVDQATLEYSGTYIVTAHRGQCTNADTVNILIHAKPKITAASNSPVTFGKELHLSATSDSSVTNYYWSGPDSFTSTLQNPNIPNVTSFKEGTYTVIGSVNGCIGSAITIVIVHDGDDILVLFPNPNDGNFTISGNVHADQSIPLAVYNAAGQLIYSDVIVSNKKTINKQVTIPYVADGVYELRLMISAVNRTIPFVVKH